MIKFHIELENEDAYMYRGSQWNRLAQLEHGTVIYVRSMLTSDHAKEELILNLLRAQYRRINKGELLSTKRK